MFFYPFALSALAKWINNALFIRQLFLNYFNKVLTVSQMKEALQVVTQMSLWARDAAQSSAPSVTGQDSSTTHSVGQGTANMGQCWKNSLFCHICFFLSFFAEKKALCIGIWSPHVKLYWLLLGQNILVERNRIYTLLSQAGIIRFQCLCGGGLVLDVDS